MPHPAAEVHPIEIREEDEMPIQQQQAQGRGRGGGLMRMRSNNRDTLLLVATLITTLSYQVGSNVPGGYQEQKVQGIICGFRSLGVTSSPGFGSSLLLTNVVYN